MTNKFSLTDFVLSILDYDYSKKIDPGMIIGDRKLLNEIIKFSDINGLYFGLMNRLSEDFHFQPHNKNRWAIENKRFENFKNSLNFLNYLENQYGIDFFVIKSCNKISHIPRDIDIFVHENEKEKIFHILKSENMQIIYSNEVESSFRKSGCLKLDIYCKISYLSKEFIEPEFLWKCSERDNVFGINYRSLNDEANFLILLVHSIFGHRRMTLLDFLQFKSLMNTIDIDTCKKYAERMGWGDLFNLGLERLLAIKKMIYIDGKPVEFPHLFDREFMLQGINSIDDIKMTTKERIFFNISLDIDRITHELMKSRFYEFFLTSQVCRNLYNSFGYYVRNKRGDRHGLNIDKK